MAQSEPSPKKYDVAYRFGAGAAWPQIMTEGGMDVVCWSGAPQFIRKDYKMLMCHTICRIAASASAENRPRIWRVLAPNGAWQIEGRTDVSAPEMIFSGSFPHRRRTNESLGSHRAAIRSGRFSLEDSRWTGRRLADFV